MILSFHRRFMLSATDMSDRIALAKSHLEHCGLCEHRCGVDRNAGERGPCKAGSDARVFRHRVEYGEELELIPSHLFYLSGCDLRCKFCIAEQNAFNPGIGAPLTAEYFADALIEGERYHPRTIQWVGGEPTIHIPAILEVLNGQTALPRVVWKSDFYSTPNAYELLDGVVDIYVADFKFGNNTCANKISRVERYVETITRNLRIAFERTDLIIRHLLLPGHFDCCYRAIVKWISEQLPNAKFSLRDGYLPRWQAHHDEHLCRPLNPSVAVEANQLARDHHLNLVN